MISKTKLEYLIVLTVIITLVIPLVIWKLFFSDNIDLGSFSIIHITGIIVMVINTQVWWIVLRREKDKKDEQETKNN